MALAKKRAHAHSTHTYAHIYTHTYSDKRTRRRPAAAAAASASMRERGVRGSSAMTTEALLRKSHTMRVMRSMRTHKRPNTHGFVSVRASTSSSDLKPHHLTLTPWGVRTLNLFYPVAPNTHTQIPFSVQYRLICSDPSLTHQLPATCLAP